MLLGPFLGTPGNPEPRRLKMAQKPFIIWSLGLKALKHESLEPEDKVRTRVGS